MAFAATPPGQSDEESDVDPFYKVGASVVYMESLDSKS